MPDLGSLPDEIVQHLLQSIHNTGDEDVEVREITFLNLVKIFPQWIPILLDSRFVNDAGQFGPRYEDVWGYRHRVYLHEQSGLWRVRDEKWQPYGAKINAWRCRNGACSHVEVEEQEEKELPQVAECERGGTSHARARLQSPQQRLGDSEQGGADDEEFEQSSVSDFEDWILNQI